MVDRLPHFPAPNVAQSSWKTACTLRRSAGKFRRLCICCARVDALGGLLAAPDVSLEPRKPSPMALAMEWVAKITTVGLQMVLPGIAGYYVDKHFGTSFWAISGFVVGFAAGLWQMIRWTKPPKRDDGHQPG